jgi:drug/metabolite transporter (DMT)-like permease
MLGLRYTTPAHSALLFALVPMLVVVISVLILKSERMNTGKAAGILLALMGVSRVIFSSQTGTATASDVWLGDGITILSVICWAVYMSYSRQLVQQFEPLTFITVLMTVGALIVLPIGIYPALTYDYSQISAEAWWGYVYLTIGSSAVSYLLLVFALKKMHASRVAIYINAQPVFTTLISLSIGTDEPSWSFLTGGLLVVTGIYVLNRARF